MKHLAGRFLLSFTLEDLRGITEGFPTALLGNSQRHGEKLGPISVLLVQLIILLVIILILIDLQHARAKSKHGAA